MGVEPILTVCFFLTSSGNEPVRDWLKGMDREERKVIGEDIKVVQFRWPLGMPLVRKMESNLWEVRSKLGNGNISRVFFYCQRKKNKSASRDHQEVSENITKRS